MRSDKNLDFIHSCQSSVSSHCISGKARQYNRKFFYSDQENSCLDFNLNSVNSKSKYNIKNLFQISRVIGKKMQLLLVKSWATECSTVTVSSSSSSSDSMPEYLRFEISERNLSLEKLRYEDSNDEVGKPHVKKILDGKTGPVRVLLPMDPTEKWSVVSGNIFQRLSDRFQDDAVEILVCLTSLHHCDKFEFASMKGKKMGHKNYSCTGAVDYSVFQDLRKKEITQINLKIVAHVPDKPEVLEEPSVFTSSQKILCDELFSDVIISFGDGEFEVKAHKCFLSAASPVLKGMFENELKDSTMGRVEMPDVPEWGVRPFLEYIYYGKIENIWNDIDTEFELLSMARKFEVSNLETEMVKRLKERPNDDFVVGQTVGVAFKIYMLIRKLESAKELKEKIIQILKIRLDELKSLHEYKDIFEKPSNSGVAMELFMDFANPNPSST